MLQADVGGVYLKVAVLCTDLHGIADELCTFHHRVTCSAPENKIR